MSSLRHMTFPGLLALLATLALRMEAGEAEWLAASLLQATAHLRALLPRLPRPAHWARHTRMPSPMPKHTSTQPIIHPHGC